MLIFVSMLLATWCFSQCIWYIPHWWASWRLRAVSNARWRLRDSIYTALSEVGSSRIANMYWCYWRFVDRANKLFEHVLRNVLPGPFMLLPNTHEIMNAYVPRYHDVELTLHLPSNDTIWFVAGFTTPAHRFFKNKHTHVHSMFMSKPQTHMCITDSDMKHNGLICTCLTRHTCVCSLVHKQLYR
jgi:hypothetical protein